MSQQRKNYLIKREFQLNFFWKFFALLLLESALLIGLFMYLSRNTLTTGYFNSVLTIERTQDFFLVPFLLLTFIILVGIGMAGMMVFMLLSHRIAGPIYRFENVLKQIQDGDLSGDVRLRKDDQLVEFEEALNALKISLKVRIQNIKKDLNDLQELLVRKDDPNTAAQIRETVNRIQTQLNHFKIDSDPHNG